MVAGQEAACIGIGGKGPCRITSEGEAHEGEAKWITILNAGWNSTEGDVTLRDKGSLW